MTDKSHLTCSSARAVVSFDALWRRSAVCWMFRLNSSFSDTLLSYWFCKAAILASTSANASCFSFSWVITLSSTASASLSLTAGEEEEIPHRSQHCSVSNQCAVTTEGLYCALYSTHTQSPSNHAPHSIADGIVL